MNNSSCELCANEGGALLWRDELLRIVAVEDAAYPGFCRVVLNRHSREMSDLASDERRRIMDAVFAVETALRETMNPDKINLACLGNLTPHVHWHVIPRFCDDRHFPAPIWAAPQRESTARSIDWPRLKARIVHAVAKANHD